MKLPKKFKQRYEKLGLYGALKLTWAKATVGRKRKIILGLKDPEERFTKIYQENHWNDSESRSGEGSTQENTQNIRSELPKVLKKYKIKSMLDAPCGDFNWMNVIKNTSIKYIGGDIEFVDVDQDGWLDVAVSGRLNKKVTPKGRPYVLSGLLVSFKLSRYRIGVRKFSEFADNLFNYYVTCGT